MTLLSHDATVVRRLRIDVHNNDNAWQRGPLWPHRMGPNIEYALNVQNNCIVERDSGVSSTQCIVCLNSYELQMCVCCRHMESGRDTVHAGLRPGAVPGSQRQWNANHDHGLSLHRTGSRLRQLPRVSPVLLCYDVNVRLSVTEVHCGRGACREEGRSHLALC